MRDHSRCGDILLVLLRLILKASLNVGLIPLKTVDSLDSVVKCLPVFAHHRKNRTDVQNRAGCIAAEVLLIDPLLLVLDAHVRSLLAHEKVLLLLGHLISQSLFQKCQGASEVFLPEDMIICDYLLLGGAS